MKRTNRISTTVGALLAAIGLAGGETAIAQPADPAVAYVSLGGNDNQKLVVMNADGTNATAILSPSSIGGSSIVHPAWSPTGNRIAFELNGGTSTSTKGLWRLDVAIVAGKPKGLNPTQLTANSPGLLTGLDPAWSPAIDLIAYTTYGSTFSIQVVPATGGAPTVLYTAPLWMYSPAWSPDGTRIAFLEHDPAFESFRIRVLDVATGVATTVLPGDFSAQFNNGYGGGYKGLDWARTGDVLAFSVGTADSFSQPSQQQPDAAIYLLDLAGGPPVLALDRGVQPAWAPDDSSLIFRDIEDSNKLRRVNLSTGVTTTFKNKLARDPDWRRF